MRRPFFLAASAIACAGCVQAWEHVSGENDLNLGERAFALVAFVKPSEESSQALEAEWSAAAAEAGGSLLSVDCEADREVCSSLSSGPYPAIRLFEGGKPGPESVYEGPRRAAAILHFLGRSQRPTVSEVTAERHADFKTADETVFIGYFGPGDESSRAAFAEVARRNRHEFSFGAASDAALTADEKLSPPAVVCYRARDGDARRLPASFAGADELERLALEAARPTVAELTPRNRRRLLDRGWPVAYLFAATEAERGRLRASLLGYAERYYDSLTAVLVDPLRFPDLPAQLGLEPGAYPALAVHHLSADRIYPYPRGQPLEPKAVQAWGLDVYQGRVKPWTPPGATTKTTQFEDPGPTKKATRRVSIHTGLGANIKIGRHDEL